jgi:hypothetical protein
MDNIEAVFFVDRLPHLAGGWTCISSESFGIIQQIDVHYIYSREEEEEG